MHSIRSIGFLLALGLVVGACGEAGVVAPDESGDNRLEAVLAAGGDPRGGNGSQGNATWDNLAAQLPGFAGIFRSSQCAAVVLIASGDPDEALRVISSALGSLTSRSCPDGVTLSVGQADYTYVQLKGFLTTAAATLAGMDGVFGMIVDYAQNRIVVAVASPAVAERVTEALSSAGVPAGAVAFRIRGSGGGTSTRG